MPVEPRQSCARLTDRIEQVTARSAKGPALAHCGSSCCSPQHRRRTLGTSKVVDAESLLLADMRSAADQREEHMSRSPLVLDSQLGAGCKYRVHWNPCVGVSSEYDSAVLAEISTASLGPPQGIHVTCIKTAGIQRPLAPLVRCSKRPRLVRSFT